MNRVERKDGYCEILLLRNKKQNLTDEYYALVSAEDYKKIKNYDWKVYKIGGRLTGATYIGRDFTTINKLLYPDLKRIHRYNDNTLDYRRFNIKHFRNEKTVNNQKKLPVEKNKLVSVSAPTYNSLEKFKNDNDLEDQDTAINQLLNKKNNSFLAKIKGMVNL
ncbi:hypothetical protein [Methanobrevibacter sp.]|uniref:hypothetical protein n=1 Tax=Methanobrevibacter sp. TaxID=66852 RepID=UPI0026193732|nr:hypothetical protein [uncultured Methanobrevibacter sp.]